MYELLFFMGCSEFVETVAIRGRQKVQVGIVPIDGQQVHKKILKEQTKTFPSNSPHTMNVGIWGVQVEWMPESR